MNIELALISSVLLLLGNAFFVGAEFALVSVRRSAIELRAVTGSAVARITLGAMSNISFLLAGAQLGITLCSLGLGALGEPALAHLLEGPFHSLHLPDHLLHPVAFALALTIMVYLHVVVGEMVPKNIALAGPERAALLLVPPLVFIVGVLRPLVSLLNAMASVSLRLVGIKVRDEVVSTYTRDEIAGLVEESHRSGLLDQDREQLLSGALQFDKGTVKTALIPAEDVVFINLPSTPAQIEQLAVKTGFSRFPVKNRGKLMGYLHLKDVLELDQGKYNLPIKADQVRPLVSVTSNESLRSVLKTMQKSRSHIAAVYNQRQKFLGTVTLEDVLEELIGEMELPSLTA